jgi:hypothetical protein
MTYTAIRLRTPAINRYEYPANDRKNRRRTNRPGKCSIIRLLYPRIQNSRVNAAQKKRFVVEGSGAAKLGEE